MNFMLQLIAVGGFVISIVGNVGKIVSYFCIGFSVVCFGFLIWTNFSRRLAKRKKMIKTGNDILRNTNSKVVLFGGDLSWVDDYFSVLKSLLNDNKTVEVFFPVSKFLNAANPFAEKKLCDRIDKLTDIGATLYTLEQDHHIRCIISDPDVIAGQDKTKILLTSRVKKNKKDDNKNKYKIEVITFNHNQEVCKMLVRMYHILKWEAKLF